VAHGCRAGLESAARADVYRDRILRGTGVGGYYATRKLGAFGLELGAVACFFTQPWRTVSASLSPADQSWLFNAAAVRLRGLGRLSEAIEPMRTVLKLDVAQKEWEFAAVSAGTLSELELTLGEVSAALADAEQSVTHADRSQNAFQQMGKRTTYADALHQAGRPHESLRAFREAEDLQMKRQPAYPQLYALAGFRFCDLLLGAAERAAWRVTISHARLGEVAGFQRECKGIFERATQSLEWGTGNLGMLDEALDGLTLARTGFYDLIGPAEEPGGLRRSARLKTTECDAAVDGLRQAGTSHHLPRGLLTRAWLRFMRGDADGCRADLDEAWEIAEPGPMRLHMADILLYRARLFRDKGALAEARKLIEQCGYWRRKEELEDAEAALT
jgi:tetratricopeptide (TPR) repeat protein